MSRNFTFLLFVMVALVGCRPEFNDNECDTAQDCFPGEQCISGECSGPGGSNNANNVNNTSNVSTVEVTPLTGEIDVGATFPLTAIARDVSGNVVNSAVFTWTSSNDTIATVGANGVVTGVAVGPVTITASVGEASGMASITVSQIPVDSLTIEPMTAVVARNRTVTFTAQPLDADGNPLLGRTGTWMSADSAIASANPNTGEVTGVELGTTTITLEMEGITATADLEVVAEAVATVNLTPAESTILVGETTQLTVVTLDDQDVELMNRVVNFTTSDGTIATVDATGLVTGIATGSVMITATSEGISDDVMVTVDAIPVATVVVNPATATLRDDNDTVQLTAQTFDANNNELLGRTITWATGGIDYVTISNTGLATGVMLEPNGNDVVITATSENVDGTSVITVIPHVDAVAVLPANPDIIDGATLQMTANVLDMNAAVLMGRTVAWQSSDDTVATVDANGLVTGVAVGTANIMATSEGVVGMTTVNIVAGPVATVTVAPATANVAINVAQVFTATSADAQANAVADTYTWTISDNVNCSIDAAGSATCTVAGTYTVTGTSVANNTVSGTATLTAN